MFAYLSAFTRIHHVHVEGMGPAMLGVEVFIFDDPDASKISGFSATYTI
jgi:hypothetical protein